MLCSILISNYNKSNYIIDCINSCINQSYKNIEIILSDNSSTDDSLKKISNYKNIKILNSPRITNFPATNQIATLLKAFSFSKGDFIFFLDADDFFDLKKIENIIRIVKKKNLDFVCDVPNLIFNKRSTKLFKKSSIFATLRSWPIVFPTSTISCSRRFFLRFQKYLLEDNFNQLEIDFRLNAYAGLIEKNRMIVDKNLTNYTQVNDGIMSSYKKFDNRWWSKRKQAHNYLKKIHKMNKLPYKGNFDYLITSVINRFLRYF